MVLAGSQWLMQAKTQTAVNSSSRLLKPNGSMVVMLSSAKSLKVNFIFISSIEYSQQKKHKGMSVVHKIENTKTGPNDRPAADVVIADSGILDVPERILVERKPVDAKI